MNLFDRGSKRDSEQPCVVVADDVSAIRAIVRGVCGKMGYRTFEAWNGDDALAPTTTDSSK